MKKIINWFKKFKNKIYNYFKTDINSLRNNVDAEDAFNLASTGESNIDFYVRKKISNINEIIVEKSRLAGDTELILNVPENLKGIFERLRLYFLRKGFKVFYHKFSELGNKEFLIISWGKIEKNVE